MRRSRGETHVPRAVIVGAGRMGRWHLAAAQEAGGAVVAVVDPDVRRADALASSVAGAASVRDLEAVPAADVLHVCTPVSTHAELVRAAVGLEADAIVEKPLADDASVTAELLALSSASGRMVIPVHQFLFQRGVRRILRRRQELGRLVRCTFVAASAGSDGTNVRPDDLVGEILPHPLSLFGRLVDNDIGELDWHVVRPAAGELRAVAVAEGTSLEIVLTARGRPTTASLEVMGTRATARADLFHGFATITRGRVGRSRKVTGPFLESTQTLIAAGRNLATRAVTRETAYPGLRELVRRTYAAITDDGPPPITVDETVAVAIARDRVLERPLTLSD